MNTFVIEEFFVDDRNACNFYTVRLDDRDVSETDRFYDEYETHEDFKEDFGMINALIGELSERGMSIIRRQRDETSAFALPPELLTKEVYFDIFENKLRLYYVQIAEGVVVLFGGGIAHADGASKPPPAFWDAQMFVRQILNAAGEAYEVIGNRLVSTNDDNEIIIY